ncbi:hypothetical protein ACH4MM_20845 [Streptomyces pratensis]|uniref:hypothetical protein n=1 Tax=Streptomyces pratensis TaxID=1169025 RepID=UPI0037B9380B
MAGESPDKSEQRKSSGTAEERDPRFAVFREPDAAAGGNTAGGRTGSATDSETAVFRLPRDGEADVSTSQEPSKSSEGPGGASEAREEVEGSGGEAQEVEASTTAPGAPVEAEEPASAATETDPAPAAEAETGSGTAAEAEDGSGPSEADERPETGAETGAVDGAAGAEAGSGSASDATTASGSGELPDAAPASDAVPASGAGREQDSENVPGAEPAARPVAGDDADADEGSDERPGTASASGSRPEPDADSNAEAGARLRAAVAAWVATDTDEEAAAQGGAAEAVGKPSEGDDAADGSGGPAVADGKSEGADDPVSADADGTPSGAGADDSNADSGEKAPAGSDATVAADSGAEVSAASDEKAPAGSGAKVSADSAAKASAGSGTEVSAAASDEKAPAGSSAKVDADSGARVSAASAAKASADSGAEVSADSGAKASAGSGAKVSAASGAKPPAGAGAGADDVSVVSASGEADAPRVPKSREEASPAEKPEPASDGRGIDHPTAVFKAPRAVQVDQPTTALKLPPKEKEAARKPASWAAKAPGTSESSSEPPSGRTSKFVPLRSDDVRPAAVVGPTVTPDVQAGSGTPGAPGAGLAEAERTRQQPMPPRPPLDLLAELTNTPPPPETPVRTAVRRVKIWTPLVFLLLIVFAIAQAARPLPEPVLELTAKQTYAFDGSKPSLPWPDEGQGFMAATGLGTVDSFGEQKAVPIGSVAKAMTAYVVLKDHPLKKGTDGPAVKIDAKAEEEGKLDSVGESTLNTVKAGETITLHDALSAIMIPSANNIARLLARWDAGSEEAFVKKMNDTAEELGMTKTTYTDPSGLNATTVSSAEDQVKLGEKLVEIPALMDITKLPSWTDPSGHSHRNYNTLVPYDGALGIKTGSTTKAGGNLLFAAHKMVGDTDQLIVGAILGQHKPAIIDTVNAVSKEAMIATQDLLESKTVVKKGQVVGVVDDGFGRTTEVVVAEDVKAVGWPGLTVKLELTDDGKTIPSAAAAGTRVGTMTVGEGASQVEVAVNLGDALAEPSFGDKLTRIS